MIEIAVESLLEKKNIDRTYWMLSGNKNMQNRFSSKGLWLKHKNHCTVDSMEYVVFSLADS